MHPFWSYFLSYFCKLSYPFQSTGYLVSLGDKSISFSVVLAFIVGTNATPAHVNSCTVKNAGTSAAFGAYIPIAIAAVIARGFIQSHAIVVRFAIVGVVEI